MSFAFCSGNVKPLQELLGRTVAGPVVGGLSCWGWRREIDRGFRKRGAGWVMVGLDLGGMPERLLRYSLSCPLEGEHRVHRAGDATPLPHQASLFTPHEQVLGNGKVGRRRPLRGGEAFYLG